MKTKRPHILIASLLAYAALIVFAWCAGPYTYYVDSSAVITAASSGNISGTFTVSTNNPEGEWLQQASTLAYARFVLGSQQSTQITISCVIVGTGTNGGVADSSHTWTGLTSSATIIPNAAPAYNGSDSYDGTEQTHTTGSTGPWQTTDKAMTALAAISTNQSTNTLLLNKGCCYLSVLTRYNLASLELTVSGTSGVGNQFTVDAYGSGNPPTILASVPRFGADWTATGGSYLNLYQTNLTGYDTPGQFADNTSAESYGAIYTEANGDYAWHTNVTWCIPGTHNITTTPVAGGLCTSGTHYVAITYHYTAGTNSAPITGESLPSPAISTVLTSDYQYTVTQYAADKTAAIAAGADTWNIYMTKAGAGASGTLYLAASGIPIATATSSDVSIADASLTNSCDMNRCNNTPNSLAYVSGVLYFNPPASGAGSGNPTAGNNGTLYFVAAYPNGINTNTQNYDTIQNINIYGACITWANTLESNGGNNSGTGNIYRNINAYYASSNGFQLQGANNGCINCVANFCKAQVFSVYNATGQSPVSNGLYFTNCTIGANAYNSVIGNPEWPVTTYPNAFCLGDISAGHTAGSLTITNGIINGYVCVALYGNYFSPVTVNGLAVGSNSSNAGVSVSNVSTLTLNGLKTSPLVESTAGITLSSCPNPTVSNCWIWSTATCLNFAGSGNGVLTMSGNYFNYTGSNYAVSVSALTGATISGGYIAFSHAYPIYISATGNTGTFQIDHNIFRSVGAEYTAIYNATTSGLTLNGWNNVFDGVNYAYSEAADTPTSLMNNTVINSFGLLQDNGTTHVNLTMDYSLGYNNTHWAKVGSTYYTLTGTSQWQSLGFDLHSNPPSSATSVNPMMVSPTATITSLGQAQIAYGLTSASPCINAGVNVGLIENTPDIGAIPYAGRGSFVGF